jgi:hypothetical protein
MHTNAQPINAAAYGITLDLNSKATNPENTNAFKLMTTNAVIVYNSNSTINNTG